jgi:hypothetical protein
MACTATGKRGDSSGGFGYKYVNDQGSDYEEQFVQLGVAPYLGNYGDLAHLADAQEQKKYAIRLLVYLPGDTPVSRATFLPNLVTAIDPNGMPISCIGFRASSITTHI